MYYDYLSLYYVEKAQYITPIPNYKYDLFQIIRKYFTIRFTVKENYLTNSIIFKHLHSNDHLWWLDHFPL